MSHSHTPGGHHGGTVTATAAGRRRLLTALCITLSVLVVELIAGTLTGSLALLADAGHMLTDSAGIGLALFASWLATRPATPSRTFGWLRAEILAALINGLLLTVICVTVLLEGISRLGDPPQEISSGPMFWVAVLGLVANLCSLLILRPGKDHSLNLKGAYLEVLGDAIGSVLVITAAVIINQTGWVQADALASLLIAVFIAPRAITLLREVTLVLLEAAPAGLDMAELQKHLSQTAGVQQVHDLHAWTITSGMPVLSAHVVINPGANPQQILQDLKECLVGHFDVAHCTFQLEESQTACAVER